MSSLFLVFALLASCLAFPVQLEDGKKPFGIDDMINAKRLSGAVVSSDGTMAAFTVRDYDFDSDVATTSMWIIDFTKDEEVTRLTYPPVGHSDSPFAWLPGTSTLLFTSSRSGSSQVWGINVSGGEAQQISDFPLPVEVAKLSPDGSKLLLAFSVYLGAGIEETALLIEQQHSSKATGMVWDSLMFRHWDHFLDHTYRHVFSVPLTRSTTGLTALTANARDLMPEFEGYCPNNPFPGAADFDISPDSKEIAFSIKTGNDYAWTTNYEIYTCNIPQAADEALTHKAITANVAWDAQPLYSPDGKFLAYLAMAVPQYEADRFRVMVVDRETGETTQLTADWDRSVGSMLWIPHLWIEGETVETIDGFYDLLLTADDHARNRLHRLDVPAAILGKKNAISETVGVHYNHDVSVIALGRGREPALLFSQQSMTQPDELFVSSLSGNNVRQVTHFNDAHFAMLEMSEPVDFWFESPNGQDQVHGWYLPPVGHSAGTLHPTVMLIHGGPQGSWADSFSYRWNPQFYAGLGYGVVLVDPHGSTGYGQAFTDAVNGDWGGLPYEDLMKGLDVAIERFDIDEDRVCAMGASYGGFMINWINGHTDRFACLINHAGLFDTLQFYYTTEELYFPEVEFLGTPFDDNVLNYVEFNPRNHVSSWKTPTFVIHGRLDYRVDEGHGYGAFTALQRQGVPSRMLLFPDENHWILKPHNSVMWHEEVQAWLAEYLH